MRKRHIQGSFDSGRVGKFGVLSVRKAGEARKMAEKTESGRWREIISGTGSERVKFTCMAVDSTARCLLFGTSSGKIYVYGRVHEREDEVRLPNSYKFDRIVSPDSKGQTDDLSAKEISEISYEESLDTCAAVSSQSGNIYLLHLGLKERQSTLKAHLLPAGHLHMNIDKHKGNRVTQLAWVRSKLGVLLCSGDDTGKVCLTDVTSEIMKKNKFSKLESSMQQMLKMKSSQDSRSRELLLSELKKEWQFDASIVQLCSTPEDTVLVSTKHATFLLHLSTNRALQLGKKPRNGFYGCCRPVRLPETDIFKALKESLSSNTLDVYKSVYVASRPGRRLWIAVENEVKGTMKLSGSSSSSSTKVQKEECPSWLKPVNAEEQSNLQLGQLFPYGKEIVSVSKSSVSVINLEECALKYSWSLPQAEEGIVKVTVLDSGTIFVLSSPSSQVLVFDEMNENRAHVHIKEEQANGHIQPSSSLKSLHPTGTATTEKVDSVDPAMGNTKPKTAPHESVKKDREASLHSHATATPSRNDDREVQEDRNSHGEMLESKRVSARKESVPVDSNGNGDKTPLPAKPAEDDKKDAIHSNKDDFNVHLVKHAEQHRRTSSVSSLQIQTKSSSKHRRNKSGSARRKKSTIAEISISKREDAIDGGEGDGLSTSFTFSAASTEQELDKLISSTISMTMEAQKIEKPAPQQIARTPNATITKERGKPVDSPYSELPPVPETTGKSNVPSKELCMFLKENKDIVLDPWYLYLHIPSDQIRESLQAWEAGLSEFGAEEEMKYKIGSMEELKGAFKTLDASLVVFPLLQWYCIRKKEQASGKKQPDEEEDKILLAACNQLHLDSILLDSEPSSTSHVQPNASKKRTGTEKIQVDIDDIVSIVYSLEGSACSEALRGKLLSCPTEFWCPILSGSIEVITQRQLEHLEEDQEVLKLQRILEVMSEIGWDLIGREFAFEFLNHFARFEEKCSEGSSRYAFRTLVRSASYHLVQMQERELVRDGIAQSILEPIDQFLNYPKS